MECDVICGHCSYEFDVLAEPEVNMGYVCCPSCGWWVDQEGNAWPPPQKN